MSNNAIWIKKFEISDELKSEYEKLSSPDKTFLVWCLEEGHVNEDEYLDWASQEFQLPVLQKSFFENDELKEKWRAAWQTTRSLYQWNESVLPLEDYSDFIRVGCIELSELKLDRPVGYILAPLSGLRSFWREIAEEKVSEAAVPDVPPPPPQEFDAGSLMASFGDSSDAPPVEEPAFEQAEANVEAPQAPDGFVIPENFSAPDIPIPTSLAPAEHELTATTKIPAPDVPQVEQIVPPPLPPPIPEVVEQAAPPPPIVVPAKSAQNNPPINPQIAGDIVGLIQLRDSKDKLEDCLDLAEVANYVFSRQSRYFDRHMLVLIKNFELRPIAWAGNWTLRSNKPSVINVDQPSIFRIVFRSKLPYHGYTKPSPMNDYFFAEWNSGVAPAHVTIIPLIVKDQLIGMIVGATDAKLDHKISLTDSERWAAELTPHLTRTSSAKSNKAAA